MPNHDDWIATIDAIQMAAVGQEAWESALKRLAAATGSSHAQLVGFDNINRSILFDVLTNLDPALKTTFAATVAINPRVRVANSIGIMQVVADEDFISPEQVRNDVFYQEFLYPNDVPFICLTTLEKSSSSLVSLGLVRSSRDGPVNSSQREIFGSLVPHVRSAVRTHLALKGQADEMLAGSLDMLSVPAFICDRLGRIVRLTQAAETLVREDNRLRIKEGKLLSLRLAETKSLQEAIDAVLSDAGSAPGPSLRTVLIWGKMLTPLVLDIFKIPEQARQWIIGPSAVIVARGPRIDKGRRAAVLRSVYALTPAELFIAEQLAEGASTDSIAAARGSNVGTVRVQIKNILAKLGVARQTEVVVFLSRL